MPRAHMDSNLQHKLTASTCVITANQRLARQVRSHYEQSQQTCTYESLDVLPLTQWLERSWRSLNPTELLLTTAQQSRCWQQVIEADDKYQQWLLPTNTAKLAEQAWTYTELWQIPISELENSHYAESQLLANWIQQFNKLCQQHHWLGNCQLATACLQHIDQLPKAPLLLVGFDDLPPAISNLFRQLQERQPVEFLQTEAQATQVFQHIAGDPKQELEQMAAWAKAELDANPNAHIGCIVPNLAENRDRVWQVFMQTFAPTYWQPGQTPSHFRTHGLPFNLSAGESFSQVGIIKTALMTLQLTLQQEWPIDSLYQLSQQPYIHCHPQDPLLAASLDDRLREKGNPLCDKTSLAAEQEPLQSFHQRSQLLTRLLHLFQYRSGEHHYEEWIQQICQLLQQLGWPGNRSLSSTETQALERWRQTLQTLTTLTPIDGKVTWAGAIQQLQSLCGQSVFQPRTDYTPIQVLGTLEAAGSEFDKVWLMGLTDTVWPPKPSPNPLLPFSLQQHYKLPHANSERELTYCRQVQARILQSAPQIIISYANKDGDRQQMPSPLMPAQLPTYPWQQNNTPTRRTTLDAFVDQDGPVLQAEEKVRGGSSLLQQQANCPFQAFAHWRLGARGLASTYYGLDAAERGTLLHKALEAFWRQVGSQQQLLSMTAEALDSTIADSVDVALNKHWQARTASLYQQIERERLTERLHQWLEQEAKRPSFTVTAFEQAITYQHKGMALRLSIDRIDELDQNQKLIIDYKTGSSSVAGWFDTRLTAPQLPIYSLSMQDCHGISYALIKANTYQYKGLCEQNLGIKGIDSVPKSRYSNDNDTWQSLRVTWQQQIEHLCNEFQHGLASVTPANAQSCLFCDLATFCRIQQHDH